MVQNSTNSECLVFLMLEPCASIIGSVAAYRVFMVGGGGAPTPKSAAFVIMFQVRIVDDG